MTIPAAKEFVLPPSGDPAVDVAYKFLATNGVVPGSAEWDAAQKGDFAPVKAALAAKGVKGGPEYVAILEDRKGKEDAADKAAKEATQAAVHAAAGGKEQWAAVTAWVSANATDAELAEVNAALKGGPFMAKIMAEGLAARFTRATSPEPAPAIPSLPDTRGAAPATNGPLTAMEFRAASAELAKKLGPSMESSPEYAALRQRRAAGLAQGR